MNHRRSCDDHPTWRRGCDPCNAQNRLYMIRRNMILDRGGKLSAAAELTVERVRQLRAAGYTSIAIGEAAGLHPNYILYLSSGRVSWVQLKTFHAVEQAYMRLRDFPGGDAKALTYARKRGWAPPPVAPLPDDYADPVVVERLTKGDPVPDATRAEKRAAFYTMDSWGLDTTTIARRLGVSGDAVSGWRRGHREPFATKPRRPHRKQRTA